ncbi:hypothetical protein [Nocardia sp. NPDC049707]|uniref:hypothetical protein n=1 Tax=Nocardia sp. NPDC049707 TaxID=3154735 RepID=UPI00343D1C88
MEDIEGNTRLRRIAELIEHFTRQRDKEICAMRGQINPDTGKQWTWDQIAAEADLSRMGVIKIYNRTAPADEPTPASPSESVQEDMHTDQVG